MSPSIQALSSVGSAKGKLGQGSVAAMVFDSRPARIDSEVCST